MTRSLENRIGIVTGAAKGMGREICLALAGEGVHLALAAREAEPLLALGRVPHHHQPGPECARLRRQGNDDAEAGRSGADRDVRWRRLWPDGRSVGQGA